MSELLKINVNDHTEKKGNLTYLSWAWAWAEVLKFDPAATYEVRMFNGSPVCPIGDTALVCVVVTINGLARECWLPAMDHKNFAVKNPDARKISDTIMRCMTKAVALHGLGLYIYAGEDLPQADDEDRAAKEKRGAELEELALVLIDMHTGERDIEACRIWYSADTWNQDIAEKAEEQKYVWGLLKDHSKLRSTIKANSPNAKAPTTGP